MASSRILAASTKIFKFSNTEACPVKSSKDSGRSLRSISRSVFEKFSPVGSRCSFIGCTKYHKKSPYLKARGFEFLKKRFESSDRSPRLLPMAHFEAQSHPRNLA